MEKHASCWQVSVCACLFGGGGGSWLLHIGGEAQQGANWEVIQLLSTVVVPGRTSSCRMRFAGGGSVLTGVLAAGVAAGDAAATRHGGRGEFRLLLVLNASACSFGNTVQYPASCFAQVPAAHRQQVVATRCQPWDACWRVDCCAWLTLKHQQTQLLLHAYCLGWCTLWSPW